MNTIKDYAAQVYWDDRARYFVAEIPEIPTCAADGATQAEAFSNLEETFAVLKEAYAEEGMPIPSPSPNRAISVERLSQLSLLVKVSRLAELSGIPGQTLATKIKRGTPISATESRRITRTLREHGLAVR
jgi:predicted RNase H-like HicB family nuclease